MTHDFETPSTSTAPSANDSARATYILQIDQQTLRAMADRLRATEGRVIDMALGRLFLGLFEGEVVPCSQEDFYLWEIRQSDAATFQASPELPPEPKSDRAGDLFDLIREHEAKEEQGAIAKESKEGWYDFWRAVVQGARETPAGFFAPAIWTWNFLSRVNRQLWERYVGKGHK